jgi:hypothetical protein
MDNLRKIMAATIPAAVAAGIAITLTTSNTPTGPAVGRTEGQAAAAAQLASTGQNVELPAGGSGRTAAGAGSGSGAATSNGQANGAPQGASGAPGATGTASPGSTPVSTASASAGAGASSTATPTSSGSTSPSGGVQYTNPYTLPPIVITDIPKAPTTIAPPQVAGPPCLMGYVWRQAVPGDYVCVTPANRAQAAADDAAAASRVNPQGGSYGPDTCLYGYIWRGAVPSDHVCVTPDTYAQTQADNGQALNRELLMKLWLSDWTPPAPPQNCSGNICSVTDGGGGAQFQVNGMNFNYGKVMLVIKSDSDNVAVWSTTVSAGADPGFYGGVVAAYTPLLDCSTDPYATPNDYLQAYDEVSGQWSTKIPVNSDCASY